MSILGLIGQFGNAQFGNAQFGGYTIFATSATVTSLLLGDSIALVDIASFEEFSSGGVTNPINIFLSDSLSNYAGLQDTNVWWAGIPQNYSETITLSDAVSNPLFGILLALSDTVSLGDNISTFTLGIINQTFSDTVSFSDQESDSHGGKNTFLFGDFINLSDALKFFANYKLSVGDQLQIGDSAGAGFFPVAYAIGQFAALNTGDAVNLSDQINWILGIVLVFAETLSLNDAATILANSTGNGLNFQESLALIDQINLLVPSLLQFTDTISLTDAITTSLQSSGLTLSDVFTFMDGISISLSKSGLQLSDTLNFVDAATIHLFTDYNAYLRQYLNDVKGPTN